MKNKKWSEEEFAIGVQREFLRSLHRGGGGPDDAHVVAGEHTHCVWLSDSFEDVAFKREPNPVKARVNLGLAKHAASALLAVSENSSNRAAEEEGGGGEEEDFMKGGRSDEEEELLPVALLLDGAAAATSVALRGAGIDPGAVWVPNMSTATVAAINQSGRDEEGPPCRAVAAEVGAYLEARSALSHSAPGFRVVYLDHTGGLEGREAQVAAAVANTCDGGVVAVTFSTATPTPVPGSRTAAAACAILDAFVAAADAAGCELHGDSVAGVEAGLDDIIVTRCYRQQRDEQGDNVDAEEPVVCLWEASEVTEAAADVVELRHTATPAL